MTVQQEWIDRVRRRIRIALWAEFLADWLAALLICLGGATLLVKLIWPSLWPDVLWLTIASLPIGLAAWLTSRRQQWSVREAVALLDTQLKAGGLLMTLAEVPSASWQDRLAQSEEKWRACLPRWRPVRLVRRLALPIVFAVGACFAPLREASPTPILQNTAGQQASQRLVELLEQMEESPLVEEKAEHELREQIEQLAEQTRREPLSREKWEALDALQERLRNRLDSTSQNLDRLRSAAAALSAAATEDGTELTPEQAQELEQDVLKALERLAKSRRLSELPPRLREALQQMRSSGSFRLPSDPKLREQMLSDLKDFLDREAERLEQLREKVEPAPGGT
ncbi:MAG: hypothetical protein GXP27_03455 [Planctomycetes bacterium]|nr:hypothetical protein [Planctomycetota bacterium]